MAEKRTDSTGPSIGEWPDVLKNAHQVVKYLAAVGWEAPQNTVYTHVRNYVLMRRKDGQFDRSTVDAYARAKFRRKEISPRVAAKPALLAKHAISEETRALVEVRRDREEELLKKARLENKEKIGALVDILLVDREQVELCQAIRMHLSPMVRSTAERVLDLVGGERATAAQIIELVGGDVAKVEDLLAWVAARKPDIVTMYKPYLRRALDVFARGGWLTKEMREAWERYRANREEEELGDVISLIREAGGDPNSAPALLERYYVRRFDW